MGLFGSTKKKADDVPIDIPSDISDIKRIVDNQPNVRMSQVRMPEESNVPTWKDERQDWAQPPQARWEPQVQPETEQPGFAPLFVKIDKYRNIIASLGSIKGAIGMLRNSFSTLNELDRARQQTMGLIQSALERIEKRLGSLDNELIRPAGFSTNAPAEEYQDSHNVRATVSDLKGQIQQLRDELQQM